MKKEINVALIGCAAVVVAANFAGVFGVSGNGKSSLSEPKLVTATHYILLSQPQQGGSVTLERTNTIK